MSILVFLYLLGALLWAFIWIILWWLVRETDGYDSPEASVYARRAVATPIWPWPLAKIVGRALGRLWLDAIKEEEEV